MSRPWYHKWVILILISFCYIGSKNMVRGKSKLCLAKVGVHSAVHCREEHQSHCHLALEKNDNLVPHLSFLGHVRKFPFSSSISSAYFFVLPSQGSSKISFFCSPGKLAGMGSTSYPFGKPFLDWCCMQNTCL